MHQGKSASNEGQIPTTEGKETNAELREANDGKPTGEGQSPTAESKKTNAELKEMNGVEVQDKE